MQKAKLPGNPLLGGYVLGLTKISGIDCGAIEFSQMPHDQIRGDQLSNGIVALLHEISLVRQTGFQSPGRGRKSIQQQENFVLIT